MAKIYDFVKYLSDKEIEMYETQKQLCITCPDCSTQDFVVFLDNTIQCSECDLRMEVEWTE